MHDGSKNRGFFMQVYLVGGAVRDHLLGHPYHEKDYVVVGATPEQLLAQGYQPVGKDFPVFLHPQTKEEYALARTERKSGHGYHGFEFFTDPDVTLEEIRAHFAKACSLNAIHKHLRSLGFVFKKNIEGKRARTQRHRSCQG